MRSVGTIDFIPPRTIDRSEDEMPSMKIGGQWRITCEPHVMVRLKRVFEGISKSELNTATLSDTLRNAFDLRWFMSGYQMVLTEVGKEWMDRRCGEYERQQAMIQQTLDPSYSPREFKLTKPARDYQAREAELCLRSGSLLVLDEVGLGKTITAAAFFTDPAVRPALYVTLTHLPTQMKEKFEEFIPGVNVHIVRNGPIYDLTEGKRGTKVAFPDIIVISYSKLAKWHETLAPMIKSVVFDEVQELRHGDSSAKGEAAAHLAGAVQYRMGLTATPVYNYGGEIYEIVNILQPDVLGERHEFYREWCTKVGHNDNWAIQDPKAFGSWLRECGLSIRHTRREVGRELPKCEIFPQTVEADIRALDGVKVEARELAKIILSQVGVSNFDKMRAAGDLDMKMRQATGIAKAPYVAAFVRMIVEGGEKVLLYGWHHAVYDIWRAELSDLRPVLYTGEQTPTQKEAAKKAFVEGDARVMIISLRAGAGLDGLQKVCNHVVFGELDWSPGVHIQCIGRLHRDGQESSVAVFYLISEEGSDPIIADVLQIKNAQLEGIRDPDAELVEMQQVDPDRMKKLAAACLSKAEVNQLANQLRVI